MGDVSLAKNEIPPAIDVRHPECVISGGASYAGGCFFVFGK